MTLGGWLRLRDASGWAGGGGEHQIRNDKRDACIMLWLSLKELQLDGGRSAREYDSPELLLNSATLLRKPLEGLSWDVPAAVNQGSWCLLFDSARHAGRYSSCSRRYLGGGLEHRLTFSLEHQRTISLLITAIATTFGTTLSIRRRLQMEQPLTAIHDSAAAWSGLGSAVLRIWHQKALPASVIGVLSALLYLGNILVLHITTPALFSVETFNSSRLVPVGTHGLPAYNWSTYNLSNHDDLMNAGSNLSDYVLDSILSFQSTVWSTQSLGLSGGTLYDVLDINSGVGNVSVDATGFNITCGYPRKMGMHFEPKYDDWALRLEGVNFTYYIDPTQPGIISTPFGSLFPQDYILLYSTIPIVDSNNETGPMVDLSRPMGNSISAIQILQCSQTLVSQTAVVDSQTRQILSVDKTIEKADSVWHPFPPASAQNSTFDTTGNLLIDAVDYDSEDTVTVADMQAIQTKRALSCGRIDVLDKQACITVLYNYDTQSVILVGNIPPSHGPLVTQFTKGNISGYGFESVTNPPFLLQGNATVTQVSVQGRLDLSIISVHHPTNILDSAALMSEIPLDGTGILHAIWLYRNHPELERLMPHVENPTDNNLREAGMVWLPRGTSILSISFDRLVMHNWSSQEKTSIARS
ncbi:hypothetical protein FB451DRAFT_1183013 [Mycena latifolia]|nr:hypothetical protein FB451DRAFT_1183013 [Mycena latifolia]